MRCRWPTGISDLGIESSLLDTLYTEAIAHVPTRFGKVYDWSLERDWLGSRLTTK
jgi:hypothetical protein